MDDDMTNAMVEQTGAAWLGLLSMATQQGASRQDIMGMAVDTAHTIIQGTMNALWPPDQPSVVPSEAGIMVQFGNLASSLANTRETYLP